MRSAWILVSGVALLCACGDEGVSFVDPESTDGDVSFRADIQPVFDAHCIDCHGAVGNGGLDLRSSGSYANLVRVPATGYDAARVLPYEPDASVLYDKVRGGGRYGDRMPLGGPYLDDDTIVLIRSWIERGSPPDRDTTTPPVDPSPSP